MASSVSESLVERVRRRTSWWVRDRWPYRPVERTVQGVSMILPWSHRLPDYAAAAPEYGQNLVRLAAGLGAGRGETPLAVLDVGANVGDSVLQIQAATAARVLAVEADPTYLRFLERNVGTADDVVVAPVLLSVEDGADGGSDAVVSVRRGGTAHFETVETARGATATAVRRRIPQQVRQDHPAFAELDLVKSDTDGFDVVLVPAIARAWADSAPVLFFEYDHVLTRRVGNDPLAVWPALADLGYGPVAVWDHTGAVVGSHDVATIARRASVLDAEPARGAHTYWDVAVAHRDDARAIEVLSALMDEARIR